MALMAIKGSLKEASLPDVIQLLFLGRRTGCLALADQHNFGTIYLDEGQIVYASIVNRRDRLGDILVRKGRITREQLQQAIEAQQDDRQHRLGEILVGLGLLARTELEEYMQLQIEEAVYYLFTWTSGTFNFEAGVRPEREDFLVRISPEALLLDGARDVRQVIEEAGLVEFEVGKALFGLITAGFAHRVGTSTTVNTKVNESRIEEHRNLGVAFYKAGMLEEGLREFRRVQELRPSDKGAPLF